jgi:ABC-2 type transport system permease protein
MNIWTIAVYEIRRMLTSRTVLIVQFALPLLLIFILGSALSSTFKQEDKEMKPVAIALVQQDSGQMKDQVSAFLENSQKSNVIQVTKLTSGEEVRQQVKQGKQEFGLIIPSDFSKKVTSGESAEWEMILGNNYAQNLKAQVILGSFLNQANLYQSIEVTAGTDFIKTPLEISEAVKSERSDGSLVKVGKLAVSDANYSASQYYAASMLIMFLLYSGMGTAISMLSEKEKHTLLRLNSMPIPEIQIMMGKIVGNSLISLLQAIIIIGATTAFYHVNWGHSYGMLLAVCLLTIAASMSLAVIGTILARSVKSVTSIFQFLIIFMTFTSGGFSPIPEGFLQKIGEFTVNHWALQSMLRMMLSSGESVIAQHIAVLACIAAGLMIISLGAYRKAGYHE